MNALRDKIRNTKFNKLNRSKNSRDKLSSERALAEDEEDKYENSDEEDSLDVAIEAEIGNCKRFWKHFRLPNLFEIITLIFLLLYWITLLQKLIFHALFSSIEFKENEFLDITSLEEYQYAIQFFDFVIGLMLPAVAIINIYYWSEPLEFIMKYLIKYFTKYFIFILALVVIVCLVVAIVCTFFLGLHAYGYYNYEQAFLNQFLVLTWGPLFYPRAYYLETYEYITKRVGIVPLICFIVTFHFFMTYIIINFSIASFLSVFRSTREEMQAEKDIAQKRKKHLKKRKSTTS